MECGGQKGGGLIRPSSLEQFVCPPSLIADIIKIPVIPGGSSFCSSSKKKKKIKI